MSDEQQQQNRRPLRPQHGDSPATRGDLERAMQGMEARMEARMEALVGAINTMNVNLLQAISTHACRCRENPFPTGLGTAERTMSLDTIDALARPPALAARTSGGTEPGGVSGSRFRAKLRSSPGTRST